MTIATGNRPTGLYIVPDDPASRVALAAPPAPAHPLEAGIRTIQTLGVEASDHLWRALTDATMTAAMVARARSPMQALELLQAYQSRALAAQSEHMNQMLTLYTRAIEDNWRSFQSLLTRGART